jgi:hypothetical protein
MTGGVILGRSQMPRKKNPAFLGMCVVMSEITSAIPTLKRMSVKTT